MNNIKIKSYAPLELKQISHTNPSFIAGVSILFMKFSLLVSNLSPKLRGKMSDNLSVRLSDNLSGEANSFGEHIII